MTKYKWGIFFASTVAIFVLLFLKNETNLYYDAEAYVWLSDIFKNKGILNFPEYGIENNSIRGYFFPWFLAIFRNGRLALYSWWIITAIMTSSICMIALPSIVEQLFSGKMLYYKRILLLLLFVMYYEGTIIYPLSDMWATGFAIWSVTFLILAKSKSLKLKIVFYMIVGLLLYASYNTRTIYLFVLIGVCVKICLRLVFIKERKDNVIQIVAILCGIIVCAIPQMISNYYQHNIISPMVITGAGGGLFTDQVYWGMEMQKYETYVGTDVQQGVMQASVKFYDMVGTKILQEHSGEERSLLNYLKIVLKHPLDFIGIYFRHIVNMMDMRNVEVYVKNFNKSYVYPLLNYILLYIFCVSFIGQVGSRRLNRKKCIKGSYIFILLLPTLAIIPGAIETRFGIMLHLMIFTWLMAVVKWRELKNMCIQKKIMLVIGFFIFLSGMCAICGNTQGMASNIVLLY